MDGQGGSAGKKYIGTYWFIQTQVSWWTHCMWGRERGGEGERERRGGGEKRERCGNGHHTYKSLMYIQSCDLYIASVSTVVNLIQRMIQFNAIN